MAHTITITRPHPTQNQWQLLQGDVLDEQETYELVFRQENDDVRGRTGVMVDVRKAMALGRGEGGADIDASSDGMRFRARLRRV